MKRSEVNRIIRDALDFMEQYQTALPPFAHWSPAKWHEKGRECDEIRDNALGWDITDFGSGAFSEIGLTLFTLRNGSHSAYGKTYAEKLLISRQGQVCPMHFHFSKMEDIINRGGGTLVMELFNSDESGGLSGADVRVSCDGVEYAFPAGYMLKLAPGQSVTLTPGLYHSFWAEDGDVLIGEVSLCNDDLTDNRFYQSVGRFPEIKEDEPAFRLLCHEYPRAE